MLSAIKKFSAITLGNRGPAMVNKHLTDYRTLSRKIWQNIMNLNASIEMPAMNGNPAILSSVAE
jgi:hypothetical protein